MKQTKLKLSRRTLLKGIAALPVVAVAGYPMMASAEMLSVDDPLAKNFKYTETSPNPDQTCANCKLYAGGSAPTGGCPLFGNKQVAAGGWCSAWVAM